MPKMTTKKDKNCTNHAEQQEAAVCGNTKKYSAHVRQYKATEHIWAMLLLISFKNLLLMNIKCGLFYGPVSGKRSLFNTVSS